MENKISVVIPHYNGLNILSDCLSSLYKNTFNEFETIVIDNGSADGSQQFVRDNFKQVKLIENRENRGYAGACNQGIQIGETEFILLLNNDTVMPQNFLREMYNAIIKSPQIAMVQPKIKSIQNRENFDYSGAAGGEMDIFGYPFARGRIFDFVETDEGQYDALDETVFWTSGCALLLRKSVVDEIGLLDEDFFAHQEEIDLNWRAQLAGFKNVVTCKTFIFHYSGFTLNSDNPKKMYLNHRNNLIMILKNYAFFTLLLVFPVRILMELATIGADFLFWKTGRYQAVIKALWFICSHFLTIIKKHKQIQKLRRVTDRVIIKNMLKSSVVLAHYLWKLSPYQCIKKLR